MRDAVHLTIPQTAVFRLTTALLNHTQLKVYLFLYMGMKLDILR